MDDQQLLYDLFQAYYKARKHKRNTRSQLHFEMDCEHKLIGLWEEIRQRTYTPNPSMCFIQEEPVKREVFASPFRDRVIHHLLFNYIAPIFEVTFIEDSFSCRQGKGTLKAQQRLEHHIRSCSDNYQQLAYVLQLDLKGYFMSIDKEILFELIRDRLHQQRDKIDYDLCIFLVRKILFRDPTRHATIIGGKQTWEGLPPSKSLFCQPQGIGLPIGDLTSQLFSNIYLNELDQFCKRQLHCKHYGRYVDDFYIVDRDAAKLKALIPQIRFFLQERLHLTLHPNKIKLTSTDKGIRFLGVYLKPFYRLPGYRIRANFKKLVYHLDMVCQQPTLLSDEEILVYRTRLNAYLGLMAHCRSFQFRKNLLNHGPLYRYFYFDGNFTRAMIKPSKK